MFNFFDQGYQNFLELVGNWLGQHGGAILIILATAWVAQRFGARLITRIFHQTVRQDLYPTKVDRERRLKTIDSLVGAFLRVSIYVIAIIMIMSELGINTGPLIASAGVLGIALGFGAQSLIKDFTSGMFIIFENQYRVGDIVELEKVTGTVEAITVRTTVIRDFGGNLHHISNGMITHSANKTIGFGGINEDILFPSDVDIDRLRKLINKLGTDMSADPKFGPKIIEPPHFVRITDFEERGIKVKIYGTTTPNDSWQVRGEFYTRLLAALRQAKIKLP